MSSNPNFRIRIPLVKMLYQVLDRHTLSFYKQVTTIPAGRYSNGSCITHYVCKLHKKLDINNAFVFTKNCILLTKSVKLVLILLQKFGRAYSHNALEDTIEVRLVVESDLEGYLSHIQFRLHQ